MKIGSIFGICMGIGVVVGLWFGRDYMIEGFWSGLALAAIIIFFKNKKNEKK